MKQLQVKMKSLSKIQIVILLLFVGLLIGVLFSNLLRDIYIGELNILNTAYFNALEKTKLDYSSLLKYVLAHNFKEFVVYWLFCFTIFGLPFIALAIGYKGFLIGFLISTVTMQYGLKGILLFFAYLFPQAIVYIPIMLVSLEKGYEIASGLRYSSKNNKLLSKHVIFEYLIIFLIASIFLFIGSLLETYLGSAFLRKTLSLFL